MASPQRYCALCGKKCVGKATRWCSRSCKNRFNGLKSHYVEGSPEWFAGLERARERALIKDDGFVIAPPGKRLWSVGSREENPVTYTPTGPEWKLFLDGGWGERMASGTKVKEVVEELGFSYQKVARFYEAWVRAFQLEESRANGVLPPQAHEALGRFDLFRKRYFVDFEGKPYTHAGHHQRWSDTALEALGSGGQYMILAPPRHGKTELLIHLCLWLIMRNPNIRIIWVGGNLEIARQSVQAIADELENNEKLRADFLKEGQDFRPAKGSGQEWTRDRFRVATRTQSGIKSPTIVAVGRGGKFLSRDADIVIADDIIDHDSTATPSAREDTLRWWTTQVVSRKEAHTAFFMIGSRQHHDDLYGSLMQNAMWRTVVESAHELDCELPNHEYMEPDHTPSRCDICKAHKKCVLWPEKRPFTFLQQQRISYGNDTLYEMVYNNVTRSEGALYVTWEDVTRSFDSRRVGEFPAAREDLLLIAGMDPSAAGDQACFLWAYDVVTRERWAIDLDVNKGGGLPGARDVIKRWWSMYQVGWWVIERNNYQGAIIHDSEIRDFCARHGIKLTPTFTTGKNKHDPAMGVTALLATFKYDPPITHLPGGDDASRAKFAKYGKQLVNFDGLLASKQGRNRAGKDDLVMASWFPELKFRPLSVERRSVVVDESPFRTSYGASMGESYQKIGV